MALLDLERVTPPAETPIGLDEAKAQVRQEAEHEDLLIGDLVAAATDHLDGYEGTLGRALVTQTWRLYLDRFPAGVIRLPLPPLQTVAELTWRDAAGVTHTLDPTAYLVRAGARASIEPVAGTAWPAASGPRSVTIRFVCGYGAAADVPAPIRSAIKLMVEDEYDQPNPARARSIERLLKPYRIPRT